VAIFRRRTEGPEGLSMTVQETFFIAFENRGAVATGTLEGHGSLRRKDLAIVDGAEWPVMDMEGFKQTFSDAPAGANVGLVFGPGVPKETFDGKTLTFRKQ
jgi:translation elongation factor EF-Tu-like GTPase